MGYTSGLLDLSIKMFKGKEGLIQLKEEWNRIHASLKHPTYYQDWRWVSTLQKCLIDDPLYFIVLYRRNEVAVILPLHLRSTVKAGIKHYYLSFPYHNHVVLSDALIDSSLVEDKDFQDILYFLETQKEFKWDYIRLSGIYDRSPFRDILVSSELELEQVSANAFFDWKEGRYDLTLSKKFIKNIKRLKSKAEGDCGEVQARFINAAADLPSAFETFLELEASGWKGEAGTSTAIKHHTRLVSFYRELLDVFSMTDSFQVNLLEINGVPAAGQMCIKSGDTWFILKVGYNDDLKQYGAGNILMLAFLDRIDGDNAASELNLVTSPAWAERWHLNQRPVYAVQHFNSSLKGRLSKVMKNSKQKIKGMINNK